MASSSPAYSDDEAQAKCLYNMFGSLLAIGNTNPRVAHFLVEKWYEIIRIWYPNMTSQVYCVPPCNFYRLSYNTYNHGMSTLKQSPFSDTKDDEAQQRVMQALNLFAKKKQMTAFILSNVVFANYMNKGYEFLDDNVQDYSKPNIAAGGEGEVDILMIDKKNNKIFVLEIKSIGDKETDRPIPEWQKIEELAGKFKTHSKKKTKPRISDQLTRNQDVVTALLTSLIPPSQSVSVVGGVVLPNVSRDILRKTLESMEQSQDAQDRTDLQELKKAIGLSTVKEILDATLCEDDLPPYNFGCADSLDDETFDKMDSVLRTLLDIGSNSAGSKTSEDTLPSTSFAEMPDDIYMHIVALFCGPLTTVSVYTDKSTPRVIFVDNKMIPEECRTEYGAARVIARRFSELVLNADQIRVIHLRNDLVHLEGPPGTGKTLILLFKILSWLDAGHLVVILSISPPSRSITYQLKTQTERMVERNNTKEEADEIKTRLTHFIQTKTQANLGTNWVEERFSRYLKKAKDVRVSTICFVVDESGVHGKGLDDFFAQVGRLKQTKEFKNSLKLWSASVEKAGRPSYVNGPGENESQKLGICCQLKMPLRCPPTVQRFLMLVQPCLDLENVHGFKKEYTVAHPAVPRERAAVKNPTKEGPTGPQNQYVADGPSVFLIAHGSHEKAAKPVWDCRECGYRLATYLKSKFHIGEEECCCQNKDFSYLPGECQDCKKLTKGSLPDTPLKRNDVMIVATREAADRNPCHGAMADALKDQDLKVASMTAREGDAPSSQEDLILCADMVSVQGLERAVIVIVPTAKGSSTYEQTKLSEEVKQDAGVASSVELPYRVALNSLNPQCRQDVFYIGSRTVCQLILIHHGKEPQKVEPMETE